MTAARPATTEATPQSILAPLIVGMHVDSPHLNLANLVGFAVRSRMPVETLKLPLHFEGDKQMTAVHHQRVLVLSDSAGKPAEKTKPSYLRLCDKRSHEDDSASWTRWHWEVSWTWHPDGSAVGLTTPYGVTFAVEQYRLQSGQIECATQLALVRHLFVDGLRAIDDQAVVHGRHDWDDSWWQLKAPPSVE